MRRECENANANQLTIVVFSGELDTFGKNNRTHTSSLSLVPKHLHRTCSPESADFGPDATAHCIESTPRIYDVMKLASSCRGGRELCDQFTASGLEAICLAAAAFFRPAAVPPSPVEAKPVPEPPGICRSQHCSRDSTCHTWRPGRRSAGRRTGSHGSCKFCSTLFFLSDVARQPGKRYVGDSIAPAPRTISRNTDLTRSIKRIQPFSSLLPTL